MDILGDLFNTDKKQEETDRRESYERFKKTPENMSNWINEILSAKAKLGSILKIPETKIIMLDFEHWKMLTQDGGSKETFLKLNEYLKSELDGFQAGKEIFLKTGIFSNKFEFKNTICDVDRENLGENLYSMYYMSMMVGAYATTEAVFREFIVSQEDVPTIYEGMPLHTEFRVFCDFDTKEIVGMSNYWHPELMTEKSLGDDFANYASVKDKLVKDYENYKLSVAEEVEKLIKGVDGLEGRWSIDVMKNGDDYWLIDMARMERSALREVMEELK